MKLRLVEEFDPVTDYSRFRIEKLCGFPRMWNYVYGSSNEASVRAAWDRVKSTKTVDKTFKVLDTATF